MSGFETREGGVAAYEEVRPLEGMRVPLRARLELRQMFERWLSRPRHPRLALGPDEMVDELDLLDLCQHYRLVYPGDAENVASIWDESKDRIADDAPPFNDLARLGWVFFDGGRWVMQRSPSGTRSYITYPSPATEIFLSGLSSARLVTKTDTPPPNAQALAAKILAERRLGRNISIKSPEWLAGRLWERLCPKPQPRAAESSDNKIQAATHVGTEATALPASLEADDQAVDRAFLEWSAWCHMLGGVCSWDSGWGHVEMRYCREAAYRALDRQSLWHTWDNDAACYADVLEKTFAIPQDQLRYATSTRKAPPRTLVSRIGWLERPDVEHLMMERLGTNTVSFAFGLLCSELDGADIESSITATATRVISFAADYPMALQQFLFRVKNAPGLLVDMLMHERAACLAVKLAIEWRPMWRLDSDRNVSREAQTKEFVVQDALALLAYHLDKGTLDLEECASLITWCYDGDAAGKRVIADSERTAGRQLLGMVAREKEELQSPVLRYLVDQAAHEDNGPRARFAAVLDALNYLSNASSVDTSPIVALYSKFAGDLKLDWSDASSLSTELAARLVAIAFAQPASDRDAMLIPFDSVKLLREARDDDKPALRSAIVRTLRVHVRLLARSVAGWPEETVPTELCAALQALVSRSVIEHTEKGRVGALTDRYNSIRIFATEEGSPAQDLAAAWRRLDINNKEIMQQALVQSDDPVFLAQLYQNLPAAAKPAIQARLRQLRPGEASVPWTWPEVQNRIESLLVAGEYALAREHLDEAEQNLDRAPSEFRLGLFGLGLQLLLKEKNWAALDVVVVPPALDVPTTQQAQNQLDFSKATSQLLRPNGNLAYARVVLQRLAARPGAASAYKENAFAVAIQQLLGPALHPLTGANKSTGESLLAEINAAIAVDDKLVHDTLLANRALLMLALQRPEAALQSVAARRHETRSLILERIAVLANVEMGLRSNAMAILDEAITEFGPDDELIALRSDLQAGVHTPSVASASTVDDSISSIRAALQRLYELSPSHIGDVLGPPGRGIRGYLTRQVSRAVAALQHMGAMLRHTKNPNDEVKFEDDLNTAVRELLGASLAMIRWNVADQSLGGATANGNPGKRDAVIRASGQEIAIYEALVCSSLDRTNIKTHFHKLLLYGLCDIFFHVIYSYAKVEPFLSYIQQMLEHEVPPGLTYVCHEFLGSPDYETSGYSATYRVDHHELTVVFLVVDLQGPQRSVANGKPQRSPRRARQN